jgi:probable blue pigment (indigoidine) exporter
MKKLLTNHIVQGLLFAMLWSSASVAAKFGLLSVEPLVLLNIRIAIAGSVLLIIVYFIQGHRLPNFKEFGQLAVFGTFNTVLYLGLFVMALYRVAAGITTLAIVINPLLISLMTAIYYRKNVGTKTILSLILGIIGVGVASFPLLQTSYATVEGLIFLGLSMLSYSFGAVYYSAVKWELPRTLINGWQILISALLLLPLTFFMHTKANSFDTRFYLSLIWLVVMVSIFAVQLWLRLLKTDAVSASLWLFLCPIFGFVYATVILNEPFSIFTAIGAAMVIFALYLGQRKG